MNKRIILVSFLFISVCYMYAQEIKNYLSEGQKVLTLLQEGKGEEMYQQMDEKSKASITVPVLSTLWGSLTAQVGEYVEVHTWKSQVVDEVDNITLVSAVLVFKNASLEYRVVFDSGGQICGLWFMPLEQQTSKLKPESGEYFNEKEVIVRTGEYELPGFLTLPVASDNNPCVIFVHGSGALDRDEKIFDNFFFRDLAHGLAKYGIASIRYDKRTYVYKDKALVNGEITLKEEVIDDVISAIELSVTQEGIDPHRVFVLGHSLGGMLAPRIATQTRELKGIIMMAANASPLEDVVLYQLNYLNGLYDEVSFEDEINKLQLQIENLKRAGTPEFSEEIGTPLNAPLVYWQDLQSYDQVKIAKELMLPVLIMNGENDYQVNMKEFNIWEEALGPNKNVSFISYPGLSHLFMETSEIPSPKDYEKSGNVPDYVINDIANWINRQ